MRTLGGGANHQLFPDGPPSFPATKLRRLGMKRKGGLVITSLKSFMDAGHRAGSASHSSTTGRSGKLEHPQSRAYQHNYVRPGLPADRSINPPAARWSQPKPTASMQPLENRRLPSASQRAVYQNEYFKAQMQPRSALQNLGTLSGRAVSPAAGPVRPEQSRSVRTQFAPAQAQPQLQQTTEPGPSTEELHYRQEQARLTQSRNGRSSTATAPPPQHHYQPPEGRSAYGAGQAEHATAPSSSTQAHHQQRFVVEADSALRGDAESQQFATSAESGELTEAEQRVRDSLLPDVLVVEEVAEAERVCRLLMEQHRDKYFACDTEVAFMDVSKESPCGHGRVICFSIYAGDEVHLGRGPPADGIIQNQLWVDSYCGGHDEKKAQALLQAFKPFFEDPGIKKVWHNYSFDRHVLANMGVHCQGFGGDTMHMARLWDSSRRGTTSYSLASLTGDSKLMEGFNSTDARGKVSMKKLFGRKNITKDGKEGKLTILPSMEQLQTDAESKDGWINYSAFDAKSTHQLHRALRDSLSRTKCIMDPAIQRALQIPATFSMWDLYEKFWKPFGGLLTDMEKEGMLVNRQHLAAAEQKALADQKEAQERFRKWARSRVPDAEFMNVGSGPQIRQLLFAGVANANSGEDFLELERVFKAPNVNGIIEEGRKVPKKNIDITLWGLWGRACESRLKPEVFTPSGWPAVSTPVLRSLAGKPGLAKKELDKLAGRPVASAEPSVSDVAKFAESELDDLEAAGVAEDGDEEDNWPTSWEAIRSKNGGGGGGGSGSGGGGAVAEEVVAQPRLSESELQDFADAHGFGRLYATFGGSHDGLEACAAVDALCEMGAIDTLLSNFILPLQGEQIATRAPDGSLDRVHCSLNINTETGRLSARRPNLQNQPALEKDRYKVRQAFTADVAKGHTLVVADYGQLELRLLAHMTNCRSMLRAFEAGGDFHSRTALGMYDHIQDAIRAGACLLEWDGPPGSTPPVPLLKDMFASERRKAKVLNFSIAYGKTAHGLSKDWKVSMEEAQETVERWYADRPEVLRWQKMQQKMAEDKGFVLTMLGRRRYLPDARSARGKAKGHAMRAAINTPIQGSAADVATAAMLTIAACPQLHAMGWKLLLQVHDEVILEGLKETAAEAKALVIKHMMHPFNGQNPLQVALNVDAKSADTWYEAK